jgi:hypothetical protein
VPALQIRSSPEGALHRGAWGWKREACHLD